MEAGCCCDIVKDKEFHENGEVAAMVIKEFEQTRSWLEYEEIIYQDDGAKHFEQKQKAPRSLTTGHYDHNHEHPDGHWDKGPYSAYLAPERQLDGVFCHGWRATTPEG